jgi:hypothetical protein
MTARRALPDLDTLKAPPTARRVPPCVHTHCTKSHARSMRMRPRARASPPPTAPPWTRGVTLHCTLAPVQMLASMITDVVPQLNKRCYFRLDDVEKYILSEDPNAPLPKVVEVSRPLAPRCPPPIRHRTRSSPPPTTAEHTVGPHPLLIRSTLRTHNTHNTAARTKLSMRLPARTPGSRGRGAAGLRRCRCRSVLLQCCRDLQD